MKGSKFVNVEKRVQMDPQGHPGPIITNAIFFPLPQPFLLSRHLSSILVGLFPRCSSSALSLGWIPRHPSGFPQPDPTPDQSLLASCQAALCSSFLEMPTSQLVSARSWKDVSQNSQAPRPVAHTVSALKAALWVLAIPTLSTLKRGQCLSGSA